MSKIIIKNGYLLDTDLPFEKLDIMIEDSTITRISPNLDEDADKIIDASGKVVMPGLIDAHTHSEQILSKGLVENLPLEPWLIYVYSGKSMSPRELYVASSLIACELVKTGTTSILDNAYFVPFDIVERTEAILKAYIDVGMRATVAPLITDSKNPTGYPVELLDNFDPTQIPQPSMPTIDEIEPQFRDLLKQWPDGRHPRMSLSLSPAGPTYASKEYMKRVADLAAEFNVGLHTHLLETKAEMVAGLNRFSMPTVRYLKEIGWLGPKCSFAHGVWMAKEDIQDLVETDSAIIHSPISNLKLGSGVAPVQMMRDLGLTVAIGSDDPSCNDSANMFEVMKMAGLCGKLYGSYDNWLTSSDVMKMCWKNGAKVLNKKVGALAPGYLADITILHMNSLFMMPKNNFFNQLVYSESGSSVETVIIDGQVVVDDGVITTVNVKELHAEAQEMITRIYTDIGDRDNALAEHPYMKKMLSKVVDHPIGFTRRLSYEKE